MNRLTALIAVVCALSSSLALSQAADTESLLLELEDIQRNAQMIRIAAAEGARPLQPGDFLDSLGNTGAVLQLLAPRADQLTLGDRLRLRNAITETITDSQQIIGTGIGAAALFELIAATSDVVATGARNGVELNGPLLREARKSGDMALTQIAEELPMLAGISDTHQFREQLRQNANALELALAVSPRVSAPVRPDVASARAALLQRGGSGAEEAAERLASALEHVVESDRLLIDGRTVAQIMRDAVSPGSDSGADGPFGVEVDQTTRMVTVRMPGEQYHGAVSAVRLVSERVPPGLSFLRDGRALLVHEGVGMEIVPMPRDLVAFAAAIENAGFEFNLREHGRIELGLGGGQRFSAVTAFDNLPGSAAGCAVVRFAEPTTAVDSPGHAFRALCPDGRAQRIVPFVHTAAFYDALLEAGLEAVTDRNTGVIGIGQVGRFKPGFFFDELTDEEIAFWQVNRSAAGIAFRFIDLTGNGVDDVVMLSARGAQPLYWVGP